MSPGAGRLRGLLLASQIALSLSLIASASLLARGSLRAAGGADAGFEFDGITSVSLAIAGGDGTEPSRATLAAAKAAVESVPGIGIVVHPPWSGRIASADWAIPGSSATVRSGVAGFDNDAVRLLKLPIVQGRWHSDDRRAREAVVSRSVARGLWNREDVIGQALIRSGDAEPYTVVGVIDEIRLVDATARPTVILAPREQFLPEIIGRPEIAAELRVRLAAVDPRVRLISRPLIDGLRKQAQNSLMGASIASGLGVVSLLLASLGVFGVFGYVVEERRREIGLRLALGASRSQVRRSVVAAMRWPVLGGLAAGLGLAIAGGVVLRSNLYGLSVLDPLSYLAVVVVLAVAAAIATYIPMRRAARVDPAVTLRAD
jgi:hypothetical protein